MRAQVGTTLFISGLLGLAAGQQIFQSKPEVHPKFPIKHCKNSPTPGGKATCETISTSVVLEAGYRNLTLSDGLTSCKNTTSGAFNTTICPDPVTCASRCGYGNVDYVGVGVEANETDNSLTLRLIGASGIPSRPRVYLLGASEETYQMFYLKNQEVSYNVDVSMLPCGSNGALYLVGMAEDGDKGAPGGNNTAGPRVGTGYCDAQCPTSPAFVRGQANFNYTTGNAGVGYCCSEMDLWEANSASTAYTTHDCTGDARSTCLAGSFECSANGTCDQDGCAINPYRIGNHAYYGPGANYTVNTLLPMTVVTQFLTNDGTSNGTLVEVRRKYIQNGKTIENVHSTWPGVDPTLDSINDKFCQQQTGVFNDVQQQMNRGGLTRFSKNLDFGMALTMSAWDSESDAMNWLDSASKDGRGSAKDTSAPGVLRGSCDPTIGFKDIIEKQFPDARVKFSHIKYGDIGSTV